MSARPAGWPALAVAVACFSAAVALQVTRERWAPMTGPRPETLHLRSGAVLRRLALGYDALLADVYWIRAIQHFGRTRLASGGSRRYDLLYPLLDITTTLDPHFKIAYRFGAIFLAEGYPQGPGRPDLAIKLLEKGFRAQPAAWQYLHDIAFVHYWWRRDYAEAARWFQRASEVPGAPEWLAPVAAVTLVQQGNRAQARFLWREIARTADHEYLQKAAALRLAQLDAMDELDRLNALIARIEKATGHPVEDWTPLAARGWLRRNPPVDPSGVPYVIDLRDHRATVSPRSPYFPLPGRSPADRPVTGARSVPEGAS